MLKKINHHFNIRYIGYPYARTFDKDFIFNGQSHDFAEIVYIDKGEMEVVEESNVYILQSGDMIFHAPLEFHKLRSTGRMISRVYNISFSANGHPPDNLFESVFRLDINERNEFLQIHKNVEDYIEGKKATAFTGQNVANSLACFIIKLCQNNNLNNHLARDSGAQHFKHFVDTMNKFLYENLSLEDLAKVNNISVSYAKVLFYRYADISPKKYYHMLRLNEAMRLIKNGMAFSEISEKMNFSSQNYFSLFFKKSTGMTPSEYKKAHDKENGTVSTW